jgi:catalase
MPLPNDQKLIQLSEDLIHQFDAIFGEHPGFRPAHAKGIMFTGTFTPAPGAADLTRAPHILRASTPVTVRFSNSTALPMIPDTDGNSRPHGIAIRFNLAEHSHTDIIAHSTDGFPTRTGAEFLEFLRAVAASSDASKPKPLPVEVFLGSHPKALAFVQTPKPMPSSFAREAFFGVTSLRFLNKDGAVRHGRYRIVPEAGVDHLDEAAAASKSPNFLFDEIGERVAKGAVSFRVTVQVAEDGDVVDDATIHWPEGRRVVDLGTVSVTKAVAENEHEQQHIIFDPIPRVDGIEASADPLLELRAAVYLISGRRRRAAEGKEKAAATLRA